MPKKKRGLFARVSATVLRDISAKGGAAGRGKKKRRDPAFYSRISKEYWAKRRGVA